MDIHYKKTNDLSSNELLEIYKLRQEVFMLEQKIYVLDIDEYDNDCYHAFIRIDGEIKSYLRVINKDDNIFIGRLLTVFNYRNKGLASFLINFIKDKYDVVKVSSQYQQINFYKKLGFKAIGNKYKEAGIFHQQMIYIK